MTILKRGKTRSRKRRAIGTLNLLDKLKILLHYLNSTIFCGRYYLMITTDNILRITTKAFIFLANMGRVNICKIKGRTPRF